MTQDNFYSEIECCICGADRIMNDDAYCEKCSEALARTEREDTQFDIDCAQGKS